MTVNKAKLNKKAQKYKDEIERLQKLIKKNKGDKRNEVRIKKVKALKELKVLNNKLKSRKISPKKYSIQYKDLQREYYNYKIKQKDIPKIDDLRLKYNSLWDWNNRFGRGVLTAMLKMGRFNNILGFDFGKTYVVEGQRTAPEAYWTAIETLKQNEAKVYNILEKYFKIKGYTWDDISEILKDELYKEDLEELWYEEELQDELEWNKFNTGLKKVFKDIKQNQEEM